MNLLKKLIIVLAALFIAQGVKAQITNPFAYDDVWNGSTTTRPQFYSTYEGKSKVFVINTAAELVWIRNNWDEPSGEVDGKDYYQLNYYLNANLDMNWSVCWIPLGGYPGQTDEFDGEFYGNGHTIRIHIWGTDANYQGLFYGIDGKVENLHVAGKIDCDNSQLVGGICGENYGWTFTMPNRDVNVRAVFMLDDNSIPMTSSMTTLENGKTYRIV